MTVDGITVMKIAHLARLQLDPDHVELYKSELNGILEWVDQLEDVKIDEVQGMACVHKESMFQREDIVSDGDYVEDVIINAPESELNMFSVPKVVE